MITLLYDEKFYPFAQPLKDNLNSVFGELLKRCDSIFENNAHYTKDYSVVVSNRDPAATQSNRYYFRIRLDTQKVIEITGAYEVETGHVSDIEMVANLPFVKDWRSDSIRYLKLKEKDKVQFLRSQEKFIGSLERKSIEMLVADHVRTSLSRKLPIVQMKIQKKDVTNLFFLQHSSVIKVFSYIYLYHWTLTTHMNKISKQS